MEPRNSPDADGGDREFAFSTRDFERVRKMILKHAGISLNAGKQNMVYSRLSRRLRATGMTSFDQYLDTLEDDHAPEWQDFVNALTTNLTAFWREPHHFPVLMDHLKARAAKAGPGDHIDIWCSAASTGEEPYTIAISAMQAFNSMTPPVRILATDIDTNVLETARRGVYNAEAVQGLAPEQRRYFLRGAGANSGVAKVRPEVQALVSFRRLNLLDATWPMRGGFSVLFCRNVMIYFDKPTQYAILHKMAPLLEPGGLLFAGHSENFSDARDLFRLKGRTVYERLPGEHALRRSH